MPTLIIQADDGDDLVRVKIANVDPQKALIAILGALATLEPKRRPRSDAGKKRAEKPVTP